MHELAVCQALMREVERVAAEQGAARVVCIHLGIGPLAGIDASLLQQAFPFASAGTCAAGAELHINTTPIVVSCETCGRESTAQPARLVCGHCNDWHTRLVSGDELQLLRLEIGRPRPARKRKMRHTGTG